MIKMNTKNKVYKISMMFLLSFMIFLIGCNAQLDDKDNQEKVEVVDFDTCVNVTGIVLESYPEKCIYEGVTYTKVYEDLEFQCNTNGGVWVDGFNECEDISENTCNELGGNFYQCESACRNDENPELCTKQCVIVCKFDEANNENDNEELVNIEVVDFESCAAAGNPIMTSYPGKCAYNNTVYVEKVNGLEDSFNAMSCGANNGIWLDDYNECEDISQKTCNELGGNFNQCASACRNNETPEMCTKQCVAVCEFNETNLIEVVDYESCAAAGNPMIKTYPGKCIYDNTVYVEYIEELKEHYNANVCESNEGVWLEEFNQCEYIGEKTCNLMGGVFNECGSACRNDPDAEFCTLQCVTYCQLI